MSSEAITYNDLYAILCKVPTVVLPRIQGGKVGEIRMYAGADEPINWLKCDGRAISRTDYADLFAVINTTYGVGDGTNTFNIPDLRGRMAIGSGTGTASGATAHALGSKSGAETVTLDVTQMPAHHHLVSSGWSSSSGTDRITYGQVSGGYYNGGTGNVQFIQDTGGGRSHNNMPPFTTVNFIICYRTDNSGGGGGGGGASGTPIPTAGEVAEFDNNAKMNSTDMTSAEVDTFVDGLTPHGSGGLNTATFTATSDENGWFQVPSTYNDTIIVWSYVGTTSVTERGEVLNTAPSASNRYSIRFKQWDDQIIYKSSSKTINIWYINK